MISTAQKSVQQRCDRRLNLALMTLWGLVLWRVGLVALGYAVLAFLGDVQAVLGVPLPDTLQTRHPDGLMVDLTIADLRHAWWVAPHLARAEQLFVLGAVGSLVIYTLKELVMLRYRARYDAVLNARLNHVIDSVEAALTKQLPAILIRIVAWANTLAERLLEAARRRRLPDLAERPVARGQPPADLSTGATPDAADGSTDASSPHDPALAVSEALIGPHVDTETKHDNGADESPSSPPTSPPYPNTFFTRF